jgi:LmbE family N-acetylglucosaminyl deacetylase
MIGAHPDDNDICGGGLALKYAAAGHSVKFLSVCNGCGGHHIMKPDEIAARRRGETLQVAKLAGIEYDVWDIPDCEVMADLETRKRMIVYIREFNPDIIFTHRTNDYHADHRNVGILVQDASYVLIVPNECPDAPAMKDMPVILFMDDPFTNPVLIPEVIVPIDSVIDTKLQISAINESQVYEWLPFTHNEPEADKNNPEEVFRILRGFEITEKTTDKEILNTPFKRAYAVRYAKVAAKHRKFLIKTYGKAGKKVRYAEVFGCSEYGTPITEEVRKILTNLK